MKQRVVFRTHYQVDEPAYVELLVKEATSPVRSAYKEAVASRLTSEVSKRHKRLNRDAAGYAVDLARGLEVITEQHAWSDKGHAVNLIADVGDSDWEAELRLSRPERLLHLWLFLEADGAAMIFLARRLVDQGRISDADSGWNSLARDMFLSIYSEYLALTANPSDRVSLRGEIDRLRSRPYEGRTGEHKVVIHLQTLYRLGLIHRANDAARRIYECPPEGPVKLTRFLSSVPDIQTLEAIVQSHRWIDVAADLVASSHSIQSPSEAPRDEDVFGLLARYYRRLDATGVPLAPLSTLITAVQITLLAQVPPILLEYDGAVGAIERLQKSASKDVRFHVDRKGRPAFVKMAVPLVTELSGD